MGYDLDQVFLALVNRSLAATYLVAAVLVLRLALIKAPKWTRGALWALVAVRLMFPLSIPSSWSAFNLVDTPVNESGVIEYAEYTGEGVKPSAVFERPKLTVSTGAGGEQPSVTVGTEREYVYLPSFAQLWLVGVGTMLLYALASYLKLRRRVAASLPMGDGVFACDDNDAPFILGVLAPRIYVPSSLVEPQFSHVLAHERAHLARRDHWWKPLGFVLLAVYWFNPTLWLAYILLCKDIELACDERVYRDRTFAERVDYSQTLLEQSRPGSGVAACPLAFGEVSVKERVKAALSYKKPAFWVVVVAVLACAVAAVCFLTNPSTLRVDFTRDDIQSVEVYYAETAEDIGQRRVDDLSGEIYERISALKGLRRGSYEGMTPLYLLTLYIEQKGFFQIRGYNDVGTMTEIYYQDGVMNKGRVWRVKDDEFGRYVMDICKYGAGQVNDLDSFLLVLKGAKSISYDPPSYFSYAYPFPITDPKLLAEVKSVLEQVEETDGRPSELDDMGYLFTGAFTLDDAHVKYFVTEGYLCMRDETHGKAVVLGWVPEGVSLNWVMENALRRQGILDGTAPAQVLNTEPDQVENPYQPTDFLVSEYDPDILSTDDLDALGAKYGFTPVHNFGRSDLFTAQFDETLTAERASEIAAALSAEPGIHFAGELTASPEPAEVMGLAYHCSDEELVPGHYMRSYYTNLNGENILIAESFGFDIDDHIVDLDDDGVTELVCNCVYGGDLVARVYVFRRNGNAIERGCVDYDKLHLNAWDNRGMASTAEWYDPESGSINVEYASLASSSGDGTTPGTFIQKAGYDAFSWEEFARLP